MPNEINHTTLDSRDEAMAHSYAEVVSCTSEPAKTRHLAQLERSHSPFATRIKELLAEMPSDRS